MTGVVESSTGSVTDSREVPALELGVSPCATGLAGTKLSTADPPGGGPADGDLSPCIGSFALREVVVSLGNSRFASYLARYSDQMSFTASLKLASTARWFSSDLLYRCWAS